MVQDIQMLEAFASSGDALRSQCHIVIQDIKTFEKELELDYDYVNKAECLNTDWSDCGPLREKQMTADEKNMWILAANTPSRTELQDDALFDNPQADYNAVWKRIKHPLFIQLEGITMVCFKLKEIDAMLFMKIVQLVGYKMMDQCI